MALCLHPVADKGPLQKFSVPCRGYGNPMQRHGGAGNYAPHGTKHDANVMGWDAGTLPGTRVHITRNYEMPVHLTASLWTP